MGLKTWNMIGKFTLNCAGMCGIVESAMYATACVSHHVPSGSRQWRWWSSPCFRPPGASVCQGKLLRESVLTQPSSCRHRRRPLLLTCCCIAAVVCSHALRLHRLRLSLLHTCNLLLRLTCRHLMMNHSEFSAAERPQEPADLLALHTLIVLTRLSFA
jgi:hypothetical protein